MSKPEIGSLTYHIIWNFVLNCEEELPKCCKYLSNSLELEKLKKDEIMMLMDLGLSKINDQKLLRKYLGIAKTSDEWGMVFGRIMELFQNNSIDIPPSELKLWFSLRFSSAKDINTLEEFFLRTLREFYWHKLSKTEWFEFVKPYWSTVTYELREKIFIKFIPLSTLSELSWQEWHDAIKTSNAKSDLRAFLTSSLEEYIQTLEENDDAWKSLKNFIHYKSKKSLFVIIGSQAISQKVRSWAEAESDIKGLFSLNRELCYKDPLNTSGFIHEKIEALLAELNEPKEFFSIMEKRVARELFFNALKIITARIDSVAELRQWKRSSWSHLSRNYSELDGIFRARLAELIARDLEQITDIAELEWGWEFLFNENLKIKIEKRIQALMLTKTPTEIVEIWESYKSGSAFNLMLFKTMEVAIRKNRSRPAIVKALANLGAKNAMRDLLEGRLKKLS